MPGSAKTIVTAIPGDGIGPDVMRAVQRVLSAADARIEWEEAEAGAAAFKRGIASGCPQETLDSIARTGLVLKGPLETPVGYGEKSANVTLRKFFELYGNIRPVRELPGIRTPFSGRGIDSIPASSTCRRPAPRSASSSSPSRAASASSARPSP
jgi:isocitrate dehydrogenase